MFRGDYEPYSRIRVCRGEPIKLYSYHPFTKEFTAETISEPDPRDENRWVYPAFSTIIVPPETTEQQAATFDIDANIWVIMPDHRGETWYNEQGESVSIEQLGDPAEQGLLKEKPPEPEKPIEIPDSIGRRQFFQQAAISNIITETQALAAMKGTIPTVINNAINALDKDYQFAAKALIIGSESFERSNSLSATITKSLGMSDDDIKGFWLATSKL